MLNHLSVTVTKDIGREPSLNTQQAGAECGCKGTLHHGLAALEILAYNRQTLFLGELKECGNIYAHIWSTHNERATLHKCGVCINHAWRQMFAVIGLHGSLKAGKCAVNLFVARCV